MWAAKVQLLALGDLGCAALKGVHAYGGEGEKIRGWRLGQRAGWQGGEWCSGSQGSAIEAAAFTVILLGAGSAYRHKHIDT